MAAKAKPDPTLDHLLFVRGGGLVQGHYPKRGAGEADLLFLPGVPEPLSNIGDTAFADLLVSDGACVRVTADGRMEDGKVHPAVKLIRGQVDMRPVNAEVVATSPVPPPLTSVPAHSEGTRDRNVTTTDRPTTSPATVTASPTETKEDKSDVS